MYHLTEDGPRRCNVKTGVCPYARAGAEHFESNAEAQKAFEASMESQAFNAQRAARKAYPLEGFGMDSFYGELPPRPIQLEALNGVAQALEEGDSTQLVAACGTGKTYMGRQLMNHLMSQEDSNGIAVVLTSSIKLAEDTAADMRPDGEGRYDRSFGEFGQDYEVIEVHSSARRQEGRQSVLSEGVISVERIQQQLQDALEAGKKVVIVSTYESSAKVQEAQAALGATAEADLLMHDEAHNILGQQTPTTTTEQNNSYTGFDNAIPGAIQSRKRLYATATPVIQELVSDKESTGDVAEAIEAAGRMAKDPKERITFYSTDEAIVGGIGGYISQQEAIDNGCLAKPDYQLRDAVVTGSLSSFKNPVVNAAGELQEREASKSKHPLTVQTYSAVSATLNAMAQDPQDGANPVHNALAYVGSISQSEAFKEHFKAVALAQSGGMALGDAERLKDSENPEERRQARLRLLAEHGEVKAAHSKTDAASKREKKAAFEMFRGKDLRAEDAQSGWSPHKRVLANVDIFSEGVSIPEIDTVIVSDDEKTSERALTQGTGRALRVIGNNPYKNTGHVIVPRALNQDGEELNGGSVAMAAYGVTRVERGVAVAKLKDQGIRPDETTTFKSYDASGALSGSQKAREVARGHMTSVADVVAGSYLDQMHSTLLAKKDLGYGAMSASEQHQILRSTLAERAAGKGVNAERASVVYGRVASMSYPQVSALRRSGKVLTSSIAAGDVGALSDGVANSFIQKGVLKSTSSVASGPTLEEKRAIVQEHSMAMAAAVISRPATMSPEHERLRAAFVSDDRAGVALMKTINTGSAEAKESVRADFESRLTSDEFTETVFSLVSTPEKRAALPVLNSPRLGGAAVGKSVGSLQAEVHERTAAAASAGEAQYAFVADKLNKNGTLKADTVRSLLREF